ncbi:kinetochore complex Sim4 subunit Fta1-domain-containing protein [Myxozyma melibiosi]|uniref:Kinetochore complex Sim4 subunit Fta1-domain-containing protein n=1 Tax=Myxozyma melibiosi TaxID=54550 RepID=A0ABR1F1E6_9ASCO
MAENEGADEELAIESLLSSTLAVYQSSPIVGSARLPSPDESSCAKYLASLRKRMLPFLELVSDRYENSGRTTGIGSQSWSATTTEELRKDGQSVDVHTVKFQACKFVILVSRADNNTENDARIVIFSRASRQLHSVFAKWIELYFDVVVRPVRFSSEFLLQFVDDYVASCYRAEESTSLEIEFTTGIAEASRITLSFDAEDVQRFARSAAGGDDNGPTAVARLLNHVQASSAIKFSQLKAGRVACKGGVVSAEGKIKLVASTSQEWRVSFAERWIAEVAEIVWR